MIKTIRLDLLELMGSGYVIEHCISALSELRREKTYQYYVADALKNINDIVAKTFSGPYMTSRLYEMNGNSVKTHVEKTGDEIAMEIIKRAGLKPKGEEVREDGVDSI